MIYLLLSIISAVIIGNLLKYFQRDERVSILVVFLGNYAVAAGISLLLNRTPIREASTFDIVIGVSIGFLYLVNFLVYNKNIRENGLSLSVSVMRVSLAIPIIISLVLFNENILFLQYLGIAIIITAFTLLGKFSRKTTLIWVFLLFIISGISDSGMKIFKEYSGHSTGIYLFFLFGSAFVFNILFIIVKRVKITAKPLLYGIILGIPNMLTSFFFMQSLDTVPGAIAYPMLGSAVVVISIITDFGIWRSRFTRKQIIVFTLLIIGIILLNIA
ncbi:MAG: EamA family transporter [bacterium]